MRIINENCISCGGCVHACPVNAIHEATPIYKIDDSCIDCGACEPVCPVEAIVEK